MYNLTGIPFLFGESGQEVDFVVYGHRGFWGIEVKNSTKVFPKDLRGIKAFREEYP